MRAPDILRRGAPLHRRAASLLLWSCFAVGGLVFSLIVFPSLLLLPVSVRRRRRYAMAMVHRCFASLVAACRALGVMRFEIENADRLRHLGRVIVIANHPSYLDVAVLLALMPRACCIVTSRHWRNPFFAGIVRSAGYLRNDGGPSLVSASEAALADNVPLIVFPEGTRSPSRGRLGKFSRGFAHISLAHDCPIVPVLIDCDPPAYTKQHRWYSVPAAQPTLRIRVLDADLSPAVAQPHGSRAESPASPTRHDASVVTTGNASGETIGTQMPLAARRLTTLAEHFFIDQISQHGFSRT
ncbi:phospholipid/glycerol acyltransferase [Pandoraea pneumonica]|jgi:1-acyl-sn-glycerol-3-phosphate acyltransferase|uniref:Phospholipid/glycerol acyltransferase n=1 Tax=Pandoraea pneumonica TaxID=2508299 RepID=A0A5E4RU87_9BURK|nr:1-acyl-sn-glycerol-3-phosphate acyltransferase [Pandoraea pneumonica]VVD66565.1 phospholipid/glycerol acyltransferase [Pandoraea pneumonica]